MFDTDLSKNDRNSIMERMDFVNKDMNWAKHWLHLHDKDEFYFEKPHMEEQEFKDLQIAEANFAAKKEGKKPKGVDLPIPGRPETYVENLKDGKVDPEFVKKNTRSGQELEK